MVISIKSKIIFFFILENRVVPVIAVAFTAIYSSVATYCYYEKSF